MGKPFALDFYLISTASNDNLVGDDTRVGQSNWRVCNFINRVCDVAYALRN